MSESVVQEFKTSKGRHPSAWMVAIYGQPSVGKSELAAKAPGAFFLDLENGLRYIDCWKTEDRITTYDDVIKWMTWAAHNDEVKTLVFDTLDELEKMLQVRAVEAYNRDAKKKVSDYPEIPYGRGPDFLTYEWRRFLDLCDRFRGRGRNVLFVGHEAIQKFANPTDSDFNYYSPNIEKKAIPVFLAKLDAMLFARFEVLLKEVNDDGKGKAVGTGRRILFTNNGTSWVGKNRFSLEPQVEMNAALFERLKVKE